jgi:hypothetical protein
VGLGVDVQEGESVIYFWGVLAGISAVSCEAMFKEASSYRAIMGVSVPLALLINYSIYRMVQLAPSLPSAFIVFAGVTLSCRIVWSLYAGHEISGYVWVAVGLNVSAMLVRGMQP